ncbi:MAG: molybdenum cofactor guanylyltransferase [Chloroflexi bacterium]|nr:molybdenum cofactor guanylyltransferase [Chloroflexota bacterium]
MSARCGYNPSMAGVSVVIQAGGASKRMGQDKALLPFGDSLMADYVLRQARALGDDIFIISNNPEFPDLGVPVHADVLPGVGALGGLHTALFHAQREFVVLLACDMPFVHLPLMRHMLALAGQHDAVIPRWQEEEYAEPFRAVYRKTCLEPVAAAIAAGERRMISFYGSVDVRLLEADEVSAFDSEGLTFVNTNTPEELEAARALLPQFEALREGWGE